MNMHEYQIKALSSRFMGATPSALSGMPTVHEVASSADGTGLELSGYFATWDVDSDDEAFLPAAFNASLPAALTLGIPVLYNHLKNEAPIGFVKNAEIRPGGLWGSLILPKPVVGTKAFDIYSAIQTGSMGNLSFSVGGLWERLNIGGKVKLLCRRLMECSITSIPTNVFATATGVKSAVGVKSIGGGGPDALWVAQSMSSRQQLAAWNAHARHRSLEAAIAGVSLELSVRELNALAARSAALRPRI